MKPLILIPSCARDRETQWQQAKLMDWLIGPGVVAVNDYRFFLGTANCDPVRDEIILPVRDDYWALPQKIRAAFRWALEQMDGGGNFLYDYVLKIDRDTFIHADRALKHYEEIKAAGIDYLGLVGKEGDCCGGGAGYWLSRKAMQTYLDNYDERQLNLTGRQQLEDWCLFWALDRANPRISPVCDRRYWDLRLGPVPDPETNITWNPWKA